MSQKRFRCRMKVESKYHPSRKKQFCTISQQSVQYAGHPIIDDID